MKHFLWVLVLLILAGCGKDRIADIATPEQIEDKDILLIFPSIPEQFCYADRMTVILNGFASDINGTDAQVLSVPENLDCYDYDFSNCTASEFETETHKQVKITECISDDNLKICLFFAGEEYKDVEGETFDETCIMGVDRQ
ncbi:MAG: hypothetical protein U9Q90_07585 [Campylobacterota bacterium]|nr:hypothetical protein [Campylobacterota bacterium]